MTAEAPDAREQEDCPSPVMCGYACDQHEGEALKVGCSFCGASSDEPCWSDTFARERMHPHPTRTRLAARVMSPRASVGG